MAWEVLMKKGKKAAAEYLQRECSRHDTTSTNDLLFSLLNNVLNPTINIDNTDNIDWCWWLMAGGRTPDEFESTVNKCDNTTRCGKVYKPKLVIYRCWTCGLNPCVALCAECFKEGNHEGHNILFLQSDTGGVCDCGDSEIMKESGFCQKHGPNAQSSKPAAPPGLLCVAEAMMPRVLLRLLHHYRDKYVSNNSEWCRVADQEAEAYISMLQKLARSGHIMRSVITQALTNPQVYRIVRDWANNSRTGDFAQYKTQNHLNYLTAVQNFTTFAPLAEYKEHVGLSPLLNHETFLEEFMFWMVIGEFPPHLTPFLLNLLTDYNFKVEFSRGFALHYSRMALLLCRTSQWENLVEGCMQVSVQLLTNETISVKMAEDMNLMEIIIASLSAVMQRILVADRLDGHRNSRHEVVDCNHHVMENHCYAPLVSDLSSAWYHRPVALRFMTDSRLLNLWFEFLGYFQGMNPNYRELKRSVDFEPINYVAAVCAEMVISVRPMWNLLSHLKTPETLPHTKLVLQYCSQSLQGWFNNINCGNMVDFIKVSFHLPLHRYYSMFMSQAVRFQNAALTEVLPSKDLLEMMMVHIFQIQTAFHEMVNGARSGQQVQNHAVVAYWQSDSCNATVDADLFLLQIGAAHLDPDTFLSTLWKGFHLMPSLCLSPNVDNSFVRTDQEYNLVESSLTMMAMIVTSRNNLGLSDNEVARLEMVTQLCIADRTHSQLINLIPERCGGVGVAAKNFEPDLEEVANYHAPSAILPGMYSPKDNVWRDMYDPIHVLLRVIDRHSYQESLQRFTNYARKMGNYKGATAPWPPFRIPPRAAHPFQDPRRLLQCKSFVAISLVLLYRLLHDPNMPETLMALVVYLLELALSHNVVNPSESVDEPTMCASQENSFTSGAAVNLKFGDWFPSEQLQANLRHTITTIKLNDSDVGEGNGMCDMLSFNHSTSMEQDGESNNKVFEHNSTSASVMEVNESVISLLLKVHSRLTGQQDSYSFNEASEGSSYDENKCRIGDGAYFVGNLLNKIADKDPASRRFITKSRESLWPKKVTKELERSRRQHKEEMVKQAKHRQEKLKNMFAWKAKRFMKKVEMDLTEGGTQSKADSQSEVIEEHTCIICGQTAKTDADPIGQVSLLQTTNVLSHRSCDVRDLVLPTDEEEIRKLNNIKRRSHYVHSRLSQLLHHFGTSTWYPSLDPNWERSIVVKTCGHFIHMSCQKSYQQSLIGRSNNEDNNLEPDKGEFLCPLCRQLSNTVIPMSPLQEAMDEGSPKRELSLREVAKQLGELLVRERVPPPTENSLVMARMEVMNKALELVSNQTFSAPVLTLSIARTNLELELVQRLGTLSGERKPSFSTKVAFGSLMHVLNLHCQMSQPSLYVHLWSQVTGQPSIGTDEQAVPLLVRDVTSLLVQLTISLLLDMNADLYRCLVRALYCVVYVQSCCALAYSLPRKQRSRYKRKHLQSGGSWGFVSVMGEVLETLECNHMESGEHRGSGESAVHAMCLPFLRVAALLKHHLYEAEMPSIGAEGELKEYLPSGDMEWCVENPSKLVKAWCSDLQRVVGRRKEAINGLLMHQFVKFNPPTILKLPRNYETIFQFYSGRVCERCNSCPKRLSICLICGTAVCFKENCCRDGDLYEAVKHSMVCGAGTCIYLLVNSCVVVVIRGKRTCLWGSLYLDSYGDEDRDLERGKPLFLSDERYKLLEEQWLNHRFDHTNKSWVWHHNSL